MFNVDFLKIGFVRFGCFTVGMADRVARKFAFTANAANFAHIFILRWNSYFFNTVYSTINTDKKQLFLTGNNNFFAVKSLKSNFF